MKRIAKRLIKFFIGKIRSQQSPVQEQINISIGDNVAYHKHSAIFVTHEKGLIELKDKVYIGRNVELGTDGLIQINEGASIQDRCIILGDVEIGKYCTFAPNVYISSGRHNYNFKPEFYIRDQDTMILKNPDLAKKNSKKVIIEDDCWLGINVVVMSGVRIGKGSVIGANSVVTKNVDPYSVMVGGPARLMKKRLDFTLKNELSYINDKDLPNFYSGFLGNLKNLEAGREMGGIIAEELFSVYMNSIGKHHIKIIIKTVNLKNANLTYRNQQKIITGNFAELVFDIENTDYHKFFVSMNDSIKTTVLVKAISVQ